MKNLADRFVLLKAANDQVIIVPATVLMHHKNTSDFFRNGQHLLELQCRQGHGLFAYHMLTGFQRSNGQRFVHVVRCGNQDQRDIFIVKQRIKTRIRDQAM